MRLQDIYDCFVKEGIKTDPRTKEQVQASLRSKRKEYNSLSALKRKFFDKDTLKNPYSDSRILYGDPSREIKRILVGIDIGPGELVLADHLAWKGEEIDLVLGHHPLGVALAGLYDVMDLQTDMLVNLGIKSSVARAVMKSRIDQVRRSLHGANHTRSVDAARLLDMPLMCCHTPSDNHVATYLQKLVNKHKPRTLQKVIDLLMKEPEYKDATYNKAGPEILVGKPNNKAGRIIVDMTGGTEGSKDIFARLSQVGIDTILGMHLSEAHFQKVRPEHTNVIIAGHMASDNLGMNLLLDKIEKKGNIEIVECSGFKRVRR